VIKYSGLYLAMMFGHKMLCYHFRKIILENISLLYAYMQNIFLFTTM